MDAWGSGVGDGRGGGGGWSVAAEMQSAEMVYVASVNRDIENYWLRNDFVVQRGPGGTYYSQNMAGAAAALLAWEYGQNLSEYNSNVYSNGDGTFSYTPLEEGPDCSQSCTWDPHYYSPIGTTMLGTAHNHPPGGYGDTSFSENKGDIPTYVDHDWFGYLATAQGGRVIMFDPGLYNDSMNGSGTTPPICSLVGPPQGLQRCN